MGVRAYGNVQLFTGYGDGSALASWTLQCIARLEESLTVAGVNRGHMPINMRSGDPTTVLVAT